MKILSDSKKYVFIYDIKKNYDGRDRYFIIEGPTEYPYFETREIVFADSKYEDDYFSRFNETTMDQEGRECLVSFIFDTRNSLHGTK